MSKHLSDSTEQQTAEGYMLASLQKELSCSFDANAVLPVDIGVKPDAIDLKNKIVVEVYARVGEVKGGQLHEVKGGQLQNIASQID